MNEDPIARAIEAITELKSRSQTGTGDLPASALDALRSLAEAVERLASHAAETERNLSSQQAILDDRVLRLERSRALETWRRLTGFYQTARRWAQGLTPAGLLARQDEESRHSAYRKWVAHEEAAQPTLESAQRIAASWNRNPVISVVMVPRDGQYLSQAMESVARQAYANWQLCIAVHEGYASRVLPAMRALETDSRVCHTVSSAGAALPTALGMATGDYVTILDEDATLSPLALYWIVEALQAGDYDLIYSDEDFLDPALGRVDPLFKPDWSPDLLDSGLYPGHLLVYKRSSLGWRDGASTGDSDEYRRFLAAAAAKKMLRVCHLPRVLYHSRATPQRRVAELFVEPSKSAASGAATGQGGQSISAIICSRSAELLERCLESIRATGSETIRQVVIVAHEESGRNPRLRSVVESSGAVLVPYGGRFNFSLMNNLAVEHATEPNLLFLNDDVRATRRGWARMLADQVSREEIGIAGAVLWYPTGVLQHAGITIGVGDGVGHTGRYMKPTPLWPWLLMLRNVSAVTGACLAIRAPLFRRIGGFDPEFPNNFNDVDLCFRVREKGYEVICVPAPGLIHHECQTRPGVVRFQERYSFYGRWAALLSQPDPYYSPSLAATEHITFNPGGDDWYRPLLAGSNARPRGVFSPGSRIP